MTVVKVSVGLGEGRRGTDISQPILWSSHTVVSQGSQSVRKNGDNWVGRVLGNSEFALWFVMFSHDLHCAGPGKAGWRE